MEAPATSIQSGPFSTFLRNRRAIVSGSVFRIGDVPILLQAADRRRSEALLRVLGDLEAGPEHVAEISFGVRRPPTPSSPPDRSYGDVAIWHARDGLVAVQDDGIVATVRGARLVFGGDTEDLAGAVHRLLQPTLASLLLPCARFLLHAALLRRGSKGLLVLGEPGSGKSTTARAGWEDGWDLLGDDLAVVDGGSPSGAAAVRRPVLFPGDLEPPAVGEPIPGDPRGRWRIPSSVLASGSATLGAIVLSRRGAGAQGGVEVLPGPVMVRHLLDAFPACGDAELLRSFLPTAAALARLPGFALVHGRDADARLEGAKAGLRAVARSW